MIRQNLQDKQLFLQLKALQIQIESLEQLKNGYKLIKIANKLLYQQQNDVLISKAITADPNRAGNNVININILLKYLKNDIKLNCPKHINELTSFNIIQDEQKRNSLIKWMISIYNKENYVQSDRSQNKFQNIQIVHQSQFNFGNKQSIIQAQNVKINYQNGKNMSNYNQFDNLYFASSMKQIKSEDIQNLIKNTDESDKVVKKGSFKLLKPKVKFTQELDNAAPKQIQDIEQNKHQTKQQCTKMNDKIEPQQLKQISMIQNDNINASLIVDKSLQIQSGFKQNQQRKTISKKSMKPPLHKANKQNIKQTIDKKQKLFFKDQTYNSNLPLSDFDEAYSSHKKIKQPQRNHQLQNLSQYKKCISAKKQLLKYDIQSLNLKIQEQRYQMNQNFMTCPKEQKLIQSKERNRSRTLMSQKKSSRKIFKIQLTQLTSEEKTKIIQWLILINIIPKSTKTLEQIINKTADGVVFAKICNYYIGRGKQISFFKEPKKSAQIHSNFQKVFNYLNQIPTFYSSLMFNYEYFIPVAQQLAIWNLLNSIYSAFIKSKRTSQSDLIQNFQSEVKKSSIKLISNNSVREFTSTKPEDKFNSCKKSIQQIKNQNISRTGSLQNKRKNTGQKKASIHSNVEFVKQIPVQMQHRDLVQNIEPNEDATFPIDSNITSGYKQLYLRKSLNFKQSTFLQTPKKHVQSNITSSLNKSRDSSNKSLKSMVKNQFYQTIPKVTLEMQMKVLKWMKENQYIKFIQNDYEQLLRDPIRNGVLINLLSTKKLNKQFNYCKNPKSIENCRQNYFVALSNISQNYTQFPQNYSPFIQQILKGQKQLFYGIVYHLLNLNGQFNKAQKQQQIQKRDNASYVFFHKNIQSAIESYSKDYMNWIRFLQKSNTNIVNLKIRSQEALFNLISKGIFLYAIAEGILSQNMKIKPIYQNPATLLQKESNVRKIITYFIQNNLLKPQMFSYCKLIAKKDDITIRTLLSQIVIISLKSDYSTTQHQRKQEPINFIKYVRNTLNFAQQKSKTNQLRTGQCIQLDNKKQNSSHCQKQNKYEKTNLHTESNQNIEIQIPWMRKLGYTQNLMLNNGILLCRILSRFTRQNIQINEHENLSKPQCLSNIRRALKLLPNCKWDELDIYLADDKLNIDIYNYIREKFKHTYEISSKK